MSRAGRINPRYGGQGLYRYLDDHVTTFAKSLGARVKALTAVDANENIFKTSFSNENRLLFRKVYLQPAHVQNYNEKPPWCSGYATRLVNQGSQVRSRASPVRRMGL